MIRVTDAIGTVAISGKFFIISVDAKTNRIIHYWDFNGLTGAYNNPNIPAFPADFSANASAPGSIIYTLAAGAPSNYSGYIDNVAGDLGNAQFGEPAGNAMRVRNPTDMVELHFKIPTTGFKNISFSYVIEESSNVSPLTRHFDYSVDGGTTWITTGLNMLTESNLDSTKYDPVTVTFASGSAAENSANLIFRIKMTGGLNTGTSGNNRYDNIVVEGDPTANAVAEVAAGSVQPTINPNPATDHITIGTARTGLKTIAVIDITGKTVLESKEIGQDIRLSTATLASGIYTVQITDEVTGKLNTIKFVKE